MDGSLWERVDGSLWRTVRIPSNNEFLQQYHQWIHKKVSDRFRRDKDRVRDTVQNVRVRLLSKDFIGRWFFKHLTHELVDRTEAEYVLAQDPQLKFISAVHPVVGNRSEPDSLWRLSDLLEYAKFDHERYFYSIQGHTIDSDSMLKLLGYPPGQYTALKSLYKQGRIKPAELTQHDCSEEIVIAESHDGKCSVPGCDKKHWSRGFCTSHYHLRIRNKCPICEKGRANLHARGLSLADDWTKSPHASSLRWEDSQLRPFLRQWRRQNLIQNVPRKIVRPDGQTGPYQGIEAGLLKYAWIMINNEVINDFKRMTRTLDISCMVFNDGVSPDIGDSEVVAWEHDDEGSRTQMVVRDPSSLDEFRSMECGTDIMSMIHRANLSDEEMDVITEVDLKEIGIRQYADSIGASMAHVNRVRNTALSKMRNADISDSTIDGLMRDVCNRHGCSIGELIGDDKVGPCVSARIDFFHQLSKLGLSLEEMESRTGVSKDRISAFVGRGAILYA